MDVYCYKYQYQKNIVDKTKLLTLVSQTKANTVEECSVTNPVIILDKELNILKTANYFYIEQFKRYYYKDDAISMQGGLVKLILSIDVLMSFKNSMQNVALLVDRQENRNTPNISDDYIPLQSKRKIDYVKASGTPFKKTFSQGSANICLVVNSGGAE